ncbi:hypothetical protein B566_EDAN012853 [Ephemera danica]|nr:hypothetical protein B566_EDAN012853 [Ephemera danica]
MTSQLDNQNQPNDKRATAVDYFLQNCFAREMMTTRKKALEGKRKRKGPSILKNYVLTSMSKTARQSPSPPSSTKSSKGEKSSPTKKKDATNPNASETNVKKTPSSNSRRKQQMGKKDVKSSPSSPTKVTESVLNFSDSTLKETLLAAVAANFNCEEFNVPQKNADPGEEPPSSSTEEKQVACETEDPIVKEDQEKIAAEAENVVTPAKSINEGHVVDTAEKYEDHKANTVTAIGMQPKICLVPVKADTNKDCKFKIILSPQKRTHQEPVETTVLNLNTESTDKPVTGSQQSSFNISRSINNDMIITQTQSSGSTQKIVINPTDSKSKGQLIPIKVVKKTETSTANLISTFVPTASPPRTQVTASTSVTNPPLFYIHSSQNSGSDMDLTALVQRNLPSILASLQKQQKVTMNRDVLPNQSSVHCPDLISFVPPTKLPTSFVESTKEMSVADTVKSSIYQPLYINTQRTDGLTAVTASSKLVTTPVVQLATKSGFDVETVTPSSSQMESTLSCEETMSVSDVTEPTPSPPAHDGVGSSKSEEQLGVKLTTTPQGANILPSRPMLVTSTGLSSNAALCFIARELKHPINVQGADAEKSSTKKKKPSQSSVKPKPPEVDVTGLLRIIETQKREIARLRRRNMILEDLNGALQTKLKIIYHLPLNQQRQEELLLRILDQMPTLVTAAVHLGQGVWLAKPEYDKVMHSAVTPSLLVRNLAVAIYGEDVLKASTVIGKHNMRMSEKGARPPLSPTRFSAIRGGFRKVDELSHTTHYLGSKIQDLRSDGSRSRQQKQARNKRQSSEESSQEGGPSGVQKEIQQPSSESPSQPPTKAAKRKPSSSGGGAQPSKKPMLQHLLVSSGDESSEIEMPLIISKSTQCQNIGATQGANKKKPSKEKTESGKVFQAKKKALGVPPDIEEEFEDWQDVCDEVARIKQEPKSDSEDEEIGISTSGTVQSSIKTMPGTSVQRSPRDKKVQAFFDSITKKIESEDS